MPADAKLTLHLGGGGLNLRSSLADLGPEELADSLNWQIDRAGALIKRLGVQEWAVPAPAAILELMLLRITGGTTYILAHCADGHIYSTTDGTIWTSIDSSLSTTEAVGWVQYMNTIYWCDATNAMRSWDGTTKTVLPTTDASDVQTVTITGTPTGGTFTLSYGGYTTSALAYNASASDVQTALVGLTSIGTGNMVCSGGALPGTGVTCTFSGTLASRPLTAMTSSDSFTGGTVPASHVTHTTTGRAIVPIGNILSIWQNRLFVSGVGATPRRVFWSVANDPTSFINKLNYVDFPADTAITAMVSVQNIVESPDGADGVLVFTENHMHRIHDGSDNVNSTISGGANVLVDNAVGCVGRRTIADMQGQIMFLARDGVYTTNGHGGARLESVPIEPLLSTFAWGQADSFVATNWKGRYLLAYAPTGEAANTRMLEVYADLPRRGAASAAASRRYGWYEWMAHDIPVTSFLVYEGEDGTVAYIAHAQSGDEAYVRLLFTGGYDVSGDSTPNPIRATARTGALLLGSQTPKRLRMVEMGGIGNVQLSVSADLDGGVGESRQFDMRTLDAPIWGQFVWGAFTWGAGGGALSKRQFYTKRGRYLTFQVTESSTDSGFNDRALGYVGAARGGAAVYSVILKITNLDSA